LVGDWKVKYINSDSLPYLLIHDLPLIAGFTGYLKFQSMSANENNKVFYRGQIEDYDLIPSLLRDHKGIVTDNDRINRRLKAYGELVAKTPSIYKADRFRNENLNPIFQHYGIKTPWIDLVDNIFVAIWFAVNKFEKDSMGLVRCTPSKENYGWIYYFQISNDLKYYDLREHHSSLSLRLHTQHGISATKKNNNWNLSNRNLNKHVVARIKFPVTDELLLNDQIFNSEFMFPGDKFDNTYGYLRREKFSDLLQEVIEDNELEKQELGQITVYG
jgi:hypothetical protein